MAVSEQQQEYAWSRAEIVDQLHALGVARGDVLLVHASFRVRPVEQGPLGLIEALRAALGDEGTLVMPSWSDLGEEPFEPATSSVSPDLGILADLFRRMPGVARSDHAFAFAAAGPVAAPITADPLPLPPHRPESPVGRIHELDGQDTTLHLAELLAGVPYRGPKHCTVVSNGHPVHIDYARTTIAARVLT